MQPILFAIVAVVCLSCHGWAAIPNSPKRDTNGDTSLPPGVNRVKPLEYITSKTPVQTYHRQAGEEIDPDEGKYIYLIALQVKVGLLHLKGKKPQFTYKMSAKEIVDDFDEFEAFLNSKNGNGTSDSATKAKRLRPKDENRYLTGKVTKWIYDTRVMNTDYKPNKNPSETVNVSEKTELASTVRIEDKETIPKNTINGIATD